jgi:hypothetical protein
MDNTVKAPSIDDPNVLRNVFLGYTRYRLLTWDTNSTGYRAKLGYAFYQPDTDEPLFIGEDFHVPYNKAIDANDVLRSLMGFLTLRIGDTDREYFDEYTPEQMAFIEGPDVEGLQQWSNISPDDEPGVFIDAEETNNY